MIYFIEHNAINKQKWDKCISHSFNKKFFSWSYILDILSPGWNALIMDDYKAVFPLAAKKKYGIQYLYQPFFINFFDVYCEKEEEYSVVATQFLPQVPSSYKYIDICISPGMISDGQGFKFIEQRYQALDISTKLNKGNYAENTKRNIRRALKEKVQIEDGFSIEEHVNDFKKENSKKIKAFSARDYGNMKLLLNELTKRGKATVFSAVCNEKLCASSSFIFCDNTVIYFKSSANEQGRRNGAMHLLIDHVIERYTNKFKCLDFYGSNLESVARFNKGFKANDYIYYRVKKNKLPALLKLIKK